MGNKSDKEKSKELKKQDRSKTGQQVSKLCNFLGLPNISTHINDSPSQPYTIKTVSFIHRRNDPV